MTPLYIPIYLYLPNMVRLATFLIYLGLNLLGPKGKILKVFLIAGYKVGFDKNIFHIQFDLSLERLSVQKKDLIDAQSCYRLTNFTQCKYCHSLTTTST